MEKYTKLTDRPASLRKTAWEDKMKNKIETSFLNNSPKRIRMQLQKGEYIKQPLPIDYPIKSAYIYGESRTGKTTSVYGYLLDMQHFMYLNFTEGQSFSYTLANVTRLMETLRSFFTTNDIQGQIEFMNKLKNVDLLVIDDIGTEKYTEWSYSQLYSLIDYRYMECLPTIYTSNLTPEQLFENIPDIRIYNRMMADCADNTIELGHTPFL